MKTRKQKNKSPEQIRIHPETRTKLEAIARPRRWKLNAAVDALCDHFIAREGVQLPQTSSDALAG